MNCLSPTPCGHFKDGCNYTGKCVNKSDHAPEPVEVVDQVEIDAKQQEIRNNTIRYFDDNNIFYADKEMKCPEHGVYTVLAGAGLWPCPECQRTARNGTKPRHISLPYKDTEEPTVIAEQRDEVPF